MIDVIIPRYPNHEGLHKRLKASANAWRLPYWDWALVKPLDRQLTLEKVVRSYKMPLIAIKKEFYIMTSAGFAKVRNPMYQFVMPNKEPMENHGIYHYYNVDSDRLQYSAPVSLLRPLPVF